MRRACKAGVVLVLVARSASADDPSLDITNYDIPQLEAAYASGQYTPVDALNFYLNRIATYDQSGPDINSVPVLNPGAMAEAQADESLIKSGATLAQYPLLGVPIVVKDSYDVAGVTTTNGVGALIAGGSGSVTNLVAPTSAFNVAELQAEGAIIIGKANMSTMAYSYDGVSDAYGRVLNPYVPTETPGGSSSGTGAAVSSSFAMFGMGGETGGSIRVPSASDGDVGLKTSAGLIDPGGTWPLTPSRDVVGPIARDVTDIAYAMNGLVHPSSTDLWNNTPYYPAGTPQPGDPGTRPTDYTSYLDPNYLQGKVIAIEAPYAGMGQYNNVTTGPYETYPVQPEVLAAFNTAVAELKALGATVITVNIPAFDIYNNTIGASGGGTVTSPNATELANLHSIDPMLNAFPFAFPTTSTGAPSSVWSNEAAAYYYEKQIESYHDPVIKNLDDLYTALKDSPSLTTIPGAARNIGALAAIYDAGQAAGFGFHTDPTTGQIVADNPAAQQALQAFANLRTQYYDAFMKDPTNPKWGADAVTTPGITHIDAFTFPTLNWLPFYQSYTGITDPTAAMYGSGVLPARFESNILGVPSITVPMGYSSNGSPMSLEFMGQFDGEGPLIGMAYSYEQATQLRVDPNLDALPNPPLYPQYAGLTYLPAPSSLVLGSISFVLVGLGGIVRRHVS
jgi:amidase